MFGDKALVEIAQLVTYVLNYDETLLYKVLQAPASINWVNTATSVNLTVGPINVPAAVQKTAKITSFTIGPGPNSTNLVTLVATNSFTPGDIVTFSGLGVATYLNGLSLQVGTASPSQFTVGFVHADVTSTSDSGTATQVKTTLYKTDVTQGTSPGNWF